MEVAAEDPEDPAALEVDVLEEPVEEPVEEPLEVPLEVPSVLPAVPFETTVPARLTEAFAARAWKLANVRVAFFFGLTLMTMVIPFWQCFPWEQYSHMGVVLLIIMVYVGVIDAVAATGMKPE